MDSLCPLLFRAFVRPPPPFCLCASFTHLVRVVKGEGISAARQQELSEKHGCRLVNVLEVGWTAEDFTFKNTNSTANSPNMKVEGEHGIVITGGEILRACTT